MSETSDKLCALGIVIGLVIFSLIMGVCFFVDGEDGPVQKQVVYEDKYIASPVSCNCEKCSPCDCVAELEAKWKSSDVEREYLGVKE